jgi:hypothetical protein
VTVGELILLLEQQDDKKRVVVSDTDGAGRQALDVEFIDQRVDRGENVITIWVHR